jgi:hypothetical protein
MPESSDALTQLPPDKRQLCASLTSEINRLHSQNVALDDRIRSVVQEKLSLTIQIGDLLSAAKSSFGAEAKWKAFCAGLNFGPPALRGYQIIHHKAKREDTFRSHWRSLGQFEKAAHTTDLIPVVTKSGEKLHAPNFFQSASRQIANLIIAWKKFISMRPLAKWSDDELASLSIELKPVSDARAQIEREIARRRSE